MVRKKRGKSKVRSKRVSGSSGKSKGKTGFDNSKLRLVMKNFILFSVLFIFSFVVYSVSTNEFYLNLFGLTSIIFGFVGLTFLVILIAFIFMRIFRK